MSFDELLDNNTNTELEREKLVAQALRRQEYNRNYQAKLRNVTKLLTLEKRIDANILYVIGYIKDKYAKEYDAYIKPVEAPIASNPMFDNWVMLASSDYKSVKDAFEFSGLSKHIDLKEFTKLFNQYYKENNSGRFIKQ